MGRDCFLAQESKSGMVHPGCLRRVGKFHWGMLQTAFRQLKQQPAHFERVETLTQHGRSCERMPQLLVEENCGQGLHVGDLQGAFKGS